MIYALVLSICAAWGLLLSSHGIPESVFYALGMSALSGLVFFFVSFFFMEKYPSERRGGSGALGVAMYYVVISGALVLLYPLMLAFGGNPEMTFGVCLGVQALISLVGYNALR